MILVKETTWLQPMLPNVNPLCIFPSTFSAWVALPGVQDSRHSLRSHTETRKLPHHVKVVTPFVAWSYATTGATVMMMMMMMMVSSQLRARERGR